MENSIEYNLEINTEEALKDLKKIKKEIKEVIKSSEFEINKLKLKRKDILVIKVHRLCSQYDLERIKKEIKKQIHKKVLIIDEKMSIDVIISNK